MSHHGSSSVGWGRAVGGAARPRVIGHRGASALAPENSLEAFARAMADGADGVELDVLTCATGEVVVFHDDDLQRLGGRGERIADLSFGELRAIRLRSGAAIPTLVEALDVCRPHGLVNIELKTDGALDPMTPELVRGVSDAIDLASAADRVIVSSFSPLALWRWKQWRPDVARALLFERQAPLPLRRGWSSTLLAPAAVHPEHTLCTPARVAGWHARGYAVNVWTVDEPARLRALAAMGVDGVISNDPAAARAALNQPG